VIGLRSQFGWALVDAVALAPAGLLVRNLDLLDPEIDVEERKRGRAAFMHIEALLSRRTLKSAPEGSSMLAAVGRCLLGSRVVADLSTWVRSSHHPTDGRLQVTLLVTTPQSKSRAHSGTSEQPGERPAERPPELVDLGLCEIDGRVCPLTDPYDDVLAIGLTSSARTKLAGALQRRGDLCA
jgi:hypothetical protein